MHVLADSLIATSYYSIPLTLFYFVRKRKDLPFNWIFLLFAAFITACGTTHILEVWTLWHPTYWLSGTIKGLTATISVVTAIALIPLVPQALALPSPTQLKLINQQLEREIGERKQVETALRQSEAKNRAILTAIPDLLLRVNRNGSCVDCMLPKSPATGKFIPIVDHLSEVLPSDSLQYQLQRIEQALTTGELQTWEHQVPKDGFLCDEEVRLVPCGEDEVLIVVRDISDRKRAEMALRQTEQKFKGAFDSLSVGMSFVSVSGGFQEVNARLCQMLGYSESQLLSLRLEDIIHPDDRQGDLHLTEQLFAGEILNYQVEKQFLCADGRSFWGLLSVGLMRDTQQLPLYLIANVTDISDRKRAEKELELQAVIVRSMADGVCLVRSTDGVIVYTNPKFDQMFGYAWGELQGQHVSVVNYGDFNQTIADQIMNSIREQGEATYEVYNVKKDGTPFWCQAASTVFNHPDFGPVLVAVQHDITLAKQAEATRQQTEQQLQATLEVLLKEIHHRVKNNLQIIYSLLRLQRRTLKDDQAAAILLDSQNRIESIALIHEKLYGAGNLATVDFSEYIPGLLANLLSSYHIHSKQITLETEIDKISLDIDKAIPCGLIINELISNSLKYAFPDQQAGQIQVTFHADQDTNVTLTVKDDGIGMPKEFNLAQADSLGLQLVHDFVDQLKGTIEFTCNAGTEFRIKFSGSHKT